MLNDYCMKYTSCRAHNLLKHRFNTNYIPFSLRTWLIGTRSASTLKEPSRISDSFSRLSVMYQTLTDTLPHLEPTFPEVPHAAGSHI